MSDTALVLADPGTRLGAAILDGIVLMVMVYAPLMLVAIGGPALVQTDGDVSGAGSMLVMAGLLLTIVGFVAWCWLTIKYVNQNGQTIAKKWLKIKTVRSDGSPASLSRLFWLRNVVNGLLGIIPLYGLIEVLFIFGESRQCLHDKIADTIVIKA